MQTTMPRTAERKTVLIVDDQPQVRRLLRHVLDRDGYKVLEAEDEATAVTAIRHRAVDLALVDMELPGPDGRHVADTLRSFGITQTLFISGLDPAQLIADGRLKADDPLVRKPFTLAGLSDVVRATLKLCPQPV